MIKRVAGLIVLLAFSPIKTTFAQQATTHLTEVRMFFVGGAIEGGAQNHTGQALVHSFKSDAEIKAPVVLYPGLGLSSVIFITTPDGREGWAQTLARAGHAAYVYDPVNTGPSGIPTDEQTKLTTWSADEVWPRFGFGGERDRPYDNTRYPTEDIGQFYASWPVRISFGERTAGKGTSTDRPPARVLAGSPGDEAALIDLLEQTGPAVLIAHSMGGATVFRLARSRPDLVKGIVVVEPVGCPQTHENIEPWVDSPFLAVYGDYIKSRNQKGRLEACRTTARLISEAGGIGSMMELTEEGVFGNTHILMQDDNSAEIASRIIQWINENIN